MEDYINKKLEESVSEPTFWETRAAMGTAETPAEPMSGFTRPPVILHMIFPKITPPAVAIEKANKPSTIILRVSTRKKDSAVMEEPTANAKRIVTMLIK